MRFHLSFSSASVTAWPAGRDSKWKSWTRKNSAPRQSAKSFSCRQTLKSQTRLQFKYFISIIMQINLSWKVFWGLICHVLSFRLFGHLIKMWVTRRAFTTYREHSWHDETFIVSWRVNICWINKRWVVIGNICFLLWRLLLLWEEFRNLLSDKNEDVLSRTEHKNFLFTSFYQLKHRTSNNEILEFYPFDFGISSNGKLREHFYLVNVMHFIKLLSVQIVFCPAQSSVCKRTKWVVQRQLRVVPETRWIIFQSCWWSV